MLPPAFVLSCSENVFDAASSDSQNACIGCPEVCVAERGAAGDRESISKMAFAITPPYWHLVDQRMLASRSGNRVALFFGINGLGDSSPAPRKARYKVGNICLIANRQRLPGCSACRRSHCRYGARSPRLSLPRASKDCSRPFQPPSGTPTAPVQTILRLQSRRVEEMPDNAIHLRRTFLERVSRTGSASNQAPRLEAGELLSFCDEEAAEAVDRRAVETY